MRSPLTLRTKLLASSVLLLCVGCLGLRDNIVVATDVDGSSDHRLFRIGAATRVMMEPVLCRLEDRELIDFDASVMTYFNGDLPPEFKDVTLRMLHDNESGLPLDLLDPLCLGDLCEIGLGAVWGTNPHRAYNRREAFVERLWDVRFRKAVARRKPRPSDVGYALMMMAICDRLGLSLDELCEKYLIEPYGLKDTAFVATQGMRNRLTRPCAGWLPWLRFAGDEIADHRGEGEVSLYGAGMLSSPSDILRVCYVILPHLDRAKGIFEERELDCGRKVRYCIAGTAGGRVFIGFEPEDKHVTVIVRNDTGFALTDGFELMDNLVNPPVEDEADR